MLIDVFISMFECEIHIYINYFDGRIISKSIIRFCNKFQCLKIHV